jgi:CheY-like chemotaxis protein
LGTDRTRTRLYFEVRVAGACAEISDDHPAERSCSPQTILFVEDEALVRMEMEEFLREYGYRVHGVADAAEAIEALEEKFAIDLVFTDINLGPGKNINLGPGKNGIELADWVLTNRPGVKVIVTTGEETYPQLPSGIGPKLQKPYTGHDLAARVRETLSKPSDEQPQSS